MRETSKEFKSSRDSLKSRLKLKPIRYIRVARFGEKLFRETTETKWNGKKKMKLNRKVFFLHFEFLHSLPRIQGITFIKSYKYYYLPRIYRNSFNSVSLCGKLYML